MLYTPLCHSVGTGGRAVTHRTVNRGEGSSIPPTAVSKLRQLRSENIMERMGDERNGEQHPQMQVIVYCR